MPKRGSDNLNGPDEDDEENQDPEPSDPEPEPEPDDTVEYDDTGEVEPGDVPDSEPGNPDVDY